MGESEREAIVVDEKYKKLNEVYQELVSRLKELEKNGKNLKSEVLSEVFRIVEEKIPFNEEAVLNINREYNIEPDQKIALDVYIGRGGVCRHQALLGAYLLEKLKEEGYIEGKVSVDRNFVEGKGSHSWIRYQNSIGDIYIIDPARKYIGRLDEVNSDNRWFYERPEDRDIKKAN